MGEVADFANGTISLCRGDFLDAGLSFASMIPVVGDGIGKGGKVAKGVVENADVVKNLDEAVGVANKEQKTLTNAELLQKSANKAEKAVGGKGSVAGIKKHQYATKLIDKYQSMFGNRGLETNFPFTNPPQKGILDIKDNTENIIYDYKFGKARMSTQQRNKYQNAFPNHEIIIVNLTQMNNERRDYYKK